MQKANKELDKDRNQWKDKSKKQLATIVRMTEANEALKEQNKIIEKKRLALENLCRQLQTERAVCIQKLRDYVSAPDVSTGDEASAQSLPLDVSNRAFTSPKANVVESSTQTELSIIVTPLAICSTLDDDEEKICYLDILPGHWVKFGIDISSIHLPFKNVIDKVSFNK